MHMGVLWGCPHALVYVVYIYILFYEPSFLKLNLLDYVGD